MLSVAALSSLMFQDIILGLPMPTLTRLPFLQSWSTLYTQRIKSHHKNLVATYQNNEVHLRPEKKLLDPSTHLAHLLENWFQAPIAGGFQQCAPGLAKHCHYSCCQLIHYRFVLHCTRAQMTPHANLKAQGLHFGLSGIHLLNLCHGQATIRPTRP